MPTLVSLALSPVLLLQQAEESRESSPTVTASLAKNGNGESRDAAVSRPDFEDRFEWQDGL